MISENYITLFLDIFKGRSDVVAEHWISRKTKKSGYSPICKNKWKKNVCRLRIDIRENGCDKCPKSDYVPISNSLIKRHLTNGKRNKILGIYPLLQDNTCNFIAGDFDNHNNERDPLADVKAFYEVCEVNEIPVYALRSRSGTGYHTYIFFEGSVPAWKARLVKFALLEEAQIIDDDKSLSSFDRLFPSQDQLSGKGFGNLIAMPFQGIASELGHTLFLNPGTNFSDPYTDQWGVLESIEKIDEAKLDEIILDWELKKEAPGYDPEISDKTNAEKYPATDYDKVLACPFMKHCDDDAENLPEPEWYCWVTITARCKNGKEIVHKISARYPNYDYQETENKIKHALQDTGPYRCAKIEKINDKYCKTCDCIGLNTSPIVLGYDDANGHRSSLVEKNGKLYRINKTISKGVEHIPITSFIIEPIESITVPDEGEFLNVRLKSGSKRQSIIFPPDCWTSNQKFLKILPAKEFIFTGNSNHVQLIRGHLASFEMPHRKGVKTVGFHDGYFVTEDGALNKDGSTSDFVYMNNIKSNCKLIDTELPQDEDFSLMKDFNIPKVEMPILGFTVACFFKPIINRLLGCFPLLGIFGEAGAGKTTTTTKITMRFWAIIAQPHSISEQTQFSLMKLADSSNSVPLCLEENKACTQDPKLRTVVSNFIRSSYNALEGQRGRPDQSLTNYRYQSPVVIAGETGFVEPAILDRLVIVEMSRKDSAPYLEKFLKLQKLPLERAGRAILEKALSTKKSLIKKMIHNEFELVDLRLTDRPRTNAAIVRFGLRILGKVLGINIDENIGIIDQAIFDGISDDGKERKSTVDMILEKMSLISVSQRGSEAFSRFDHLEEGIHFQRVEVDEMNYHLRLYVAKSYPGFKIWAKVTSWEGDILPESDFKKQLRNEKYFVVKKPAKIGTKTRNCYILDIDKMKKKGLDISEEWDYPTLNDIE